MKARCVGHRISQGVLAHEVGPRGVPDLSVGQDLGRARPGLGDDRNDKLRDIVVQIQVVGEDWEFDGYALLG